MKKIFALIIFFFIFTPVSNSEIDEGEAKKTKIWTKCKPEKGVKVNFKNEDEKLKTQELENLLLGNTLVSVDRWGTFAIYYPSKKQTVGWMPKIHKNGVVEDWTKGTVTFENDKYCRQWVYWKSGKNINCWNAFEGEKRIDMRSFYFTCRNGKPDGDQHIVFPGNIFNVEYEGTSNADGKLTQNVDAAETVINKYFSQYKK
jgi:hypothetical protein